MLFNLPIPLKYALEELYRGRSVWDFAAQFLTAFSHGCPFDYGQLTLSPRQVSIRWGVLQRAFLDARAEIIRSSPNAAPSSILFRNISQIFFPSDEHPEIIADILETSRQRLDLINTNIQMIHGALEVLNERLDIQRESLSVVQNTHHEFLEVLKQFKGFLRGGTTDRSAPKTTSVSPDLADASNSSQGGRKVTGFESNSYIYIFFC